MWSFCHYGAQKTSSGNMERTKVFFVLFYWDVICLRTLTFNTQNYWKWVATFLEGRLCELFTAFGGKKKDKLLLFFRRGFSPWNQAQKSPLLFCFVFLFFFLCFCDHGSGEAVSSVLGQSSSFSSKAGTAHPDSSASQPNALHRSQVTNSNRLRLCVTFLFICVCLPLVPLLSFAVTFESFGFQHTFFF